MAGRCPPLLSRSQLNFGAPPSVTGYPELGSVNDGSQIFGRYELPLKGTLLSGRDPAGIIEERRRASSRTPRFFANCGGS